MKELDVDLGKIYKEDGFYYLEKIFYSLDDIIDSEPAIKSLSRKNGFDIIKSSWKIEKNPFYTIDFIMSDGCVSVASEVRFVYAMKLEYTK